MSTTPAVMRPGFVADLVNLVLFRPVYRQSRHVGEMDLASDRASAGHRQPSTVQQARDAMASTALRLDLTLAAESGNTEAMVRLGSLLLERNDATDLDEAREWLTRAATAATRTEPPFQGELVADGLIRLTGFVSATSPIGSTRLYTDETFRVWIDVKDSDIEHLESPPPERPDAPSQLWVRRTAQVPRGTSTTIADERLIDLVDVASVHRQAPP